MYDSAWRSDGWVCDWPGLASLGRCRPDLEPRHPTAHRAGAPLRPSRSTPWSRSGSAWTSDALIAIYQAAFPVLNRYEEITWFDANGWKLAGYHRTYGQIQQKTSYDEFLAYTEDPAKNAAPGWLHGPLLQGEPGGRVPAGACGVQ